MTRPLSRRDLLSGPAAFVALGAGAGLAPRAPGTVGTLIGIPMLWLMPESPVAYLAVTVVLFAFGIWCCGVTAERLGVHDHGGIVWDEVVGYLVAMYTMPRTIGWVIAGFVAFRLFDIWKPWPIRVFDRRIAGGLGIMIDDVLAGVLAALVLQAAWRLVG